MDSVNRGLISTLRRLKDHRLIQKVGEHCQFCGKEIPDDHRHLLELMQKQLICVCDSCFIIGSIRHEQYKIIPQRTVWLNHFDISEELWSRFLIPVNMAFFLFDSARNSIIAHYPAAAGATESKLKMEPWKELEELNPELKTMLPDVEALLVNRLDNSQQYFIVPIDACYKLIGLMRTQWKGIFGGTAIQNIIRDFFTALQINHSHA